jgi:predicted RNA-binding protein (virulence factor B family)
VLQPGTFATLKVGQESNEGVLLFDAGNHAVLLPSKEYENAPVAGRYLQAFLYQNNTGTLLATLKQPKIILGEAGLLTVKSVTEAGAFADWGIDKDLFVPFKEQAIRMQEGKSYVIVAYWDETSERLAGSTRLNRYLTNVGHEFEEGMQVNILVADSSDLGINVVIEKHFLGLMYHNEIFKPVHYGDNMIAFIKALRPNNKIDVSLQKQGYEAVDDVADELLTAIEKNKGFLPLTDKSSPEDIKAALGMSKKLFKKAVGQLYRQRVISLHDDGLRLTDVE